MLCGNYILSNRSEWTFYFLSSVQFNFTIGEKLILEKKIDFYSPHTRQEYLVLDKFASPEHRKTVVDDDFQVYFQYSVPIISARWIINIIYEKMILMGFTVLEKFFMNYCLTKRHEKLKL